MKKVEISFILPAYNVCDYLQNCIRSIEKQELSSYEIIIVDDGSTDDTFPAACKLGETNPCIRVLHQENRGVSAARNRGLDEANGEYVCFVDPDDFFIEKFAEEFLTKCKTYKLDIIRGQYRFYYEGEKERGGSLPFAKPGVVLTGQEYLIRCIKDRTLEVVPFLSVIRRDFLVRNGIRFPEGIGYEEDQIHMLECMLADKCKVMQENTYFYAYRQRPSSVTRNAKPKQIRDVIAVMDMEQRLIDSRKISRGTKRILRRYISASFYQITSLYANLKKEERKKIYKEIPKSRIVQSILYPVKKRFAVKSMVFLIAPEVMLKMVQTASRDSED